MAKLVDKGIMHRTEDKWDKTKQGGWGENAMLENKGNTTSVYPSNIGKADERGGKGQVDDKCKGPPR